MVHPQKILLIQLRRIGDVLMCTPALRALRTHFPKSYIAFLTEREFSDLLTLNPYLDEVIILERERYRSPFYWLKSIWQIRKKSFDLVFDFMGNPRSALIALLSGTKQRVGFTLSFRRFFYNIIIRGDGVPKYSALHKLGALKALGKENFDCRLDFFIPNEAQKFAENFLKETGLDQNHLIISLSPTSRRHFRRWPPEKFARLGDWLSSQFRATVLLVWGPGEREAVERVRNLMKESPVLSGETKDLFQLGALLERCALHIGNDNGTKHIAVAMGKPTITIYGPDEPANWTYPDPLRHGFLKKNVDCPDCDKVKHKCTQLSCLDQITVEDVQEAFIQLQQSLGIAKREQLSKNWDECIRR